MSKPLVEELQIYMREQRAKLSHGHDLAKAIDYILNRWAAFTLFLNNGRVCLSNNGAERALRGIALGRKSWLFCGSDRGRSRGGLSTKIHATVDALGNPTGFFLTGGEVHDLVGADHLLPR